jgi:hypothetical protein
MKTAATLLAFAAGASAFTSTQPSLRSTAMSGAVDDMDGAINFAAKPFKFDPVSDVDRGFFFESRIF